MPTFHSIEEIMADIKLKMRPAIQKAEEEVYQVINRFVKEYYSEFSPEMYDRTYQLYQSLVKSEIIPFGNGYKARVYFDIDKLDYAMKSVNGVSMPNSGWSEEKTMSAAAHGSHGGYVSGTAIYDEPVEVLNAEAYEILKRMLIESGIPLK